MTRAALFDNFRAGAWRYLQPCIPPFITSRLRARFGAVRFSGDYARWDEALRDCRGYNAHDILAQVVRATSAVHEGRAVYERDAVLFDTVQHSWPVLASLLWIAQIRSHQLHVLDVGGSLGSSYRQHASFLAALDRLEWSIVEQPHFVEVGKRRFEDATLRFYPTIAASLTRRQPDVALLSSVLPYVEEPYSLLENVMAADIEFILIDRTPLIEAAADRLCVQRVSPRLIDASYPAWFLSRAKLLAALHGRYRTVAEFDSLDRPHIRSRSQGFLLQRLPTGSHADI